MAQSRSLPSVKPVQVYRLRGISVSVFANQAQREGRESTYHKVSIQRTYKDGEEFKTTTSLSRDDLPVASMLLSRAWEYILQAEAKRGKSDDDQDE